MQRVQKILVVLFLLFFAKHSTAQDSLFTKADLKNLNLSVLSVSERSYITFTRGLGENIVNDKTEKLEPLIFEAKVSPNYYIRFGKGSNIAISLNPTIYIRMFNKESNPIYSPSYKPTLNLFQVLGGLNIKESRVTEFLGLYKGTSLFQTFSITHHSNGQEEPFIDETTNEINLNRGNFSTDYITYSLNWSNFESQKDQNIIANGSLSIEQHFNFLTREKQINDSYYYTKTQLTSTFIYEDPNFNFFNKSILKYSFATYIHQDFEELKFHFDGLYGFKIFKGMDFFIFARAYIGPDYYNSRYVFNRRALTFGIMTDALSLPLFND